LLFSNDTLLPTRELSTTSLEAIKAIIRVVSLAAGSRLGPYEIVAAIGAGGMGEVYKARDSRLDRTVAIKVLSQSLATDPSFHSRFERETKAVAALSHPNIVAIHDVGSENGVVFAVMELLDGTTLRERLTAHGPHGLPLQKALDIALQVARGLSAAHDKGLVHRDIKPENLFITSDGRAKILDFGLAKQPIGGGPAATVTPTLPLATTPGTMLGTVGYLAPEQARGYAIDQRADIFGLGAVLYEMLSGQRAFPGGTPADTISAILNLDPPDLSEIEPTVSPGLDRIVRRCLEKNVAERFHSAHDLAIALEAVSGDRRASSIAPVAPATGASTRWLRAGVAVALAAACAALGAIVSLSVRPATRAAGRVHAALLPPDGIDVSDAPSVSPDGRSVAFVGVDTNVVTRLWIRRLSDSSARLLPGTDDAKFPFWSPDGRSLAFFAQGQLKRIELAGGPPRALAPVSDPRGGSWSKDGVIVLAPNSGDGLYRMPADGGPVSRLTTLDAGRHEVSHRWPVFLPDGKHVLFVNRSPNPDERLAIFSVALDAPERLEKLMPAQSTGMYANGKLWWARGTTLFAQPFDAAQLKLTGEMVAVLEHVLVDQSMDGLVAVSVAGETIAARTAEQPESQLTWFDRRGQRLGVLGPRGASDPDISPDGRMLAFDRAESMETGAKTGLWTSALDRGTIARVGPSLRNDVMPTWSPDGRTLIFASDRGGSFDLFEKSLGPEPERELLHSPLWKYPESWSPDGRTLLFSQLDPKSRIDLWLLPLDGGKPTLFVGTDADETQGRFSADGRWIAYTSSESGRAEVYVQRFPRSDGRWQISQDGGSNPLWRRDGGELFFLSLDNRVMSAEVRNHSTAFDAAVPTSLFQASRLSRRSALLGGDRYYAVTPGGDRFLVNQSTSDLRASAITIVIDR